MKKLSKKFVVVLCVVTAVLLGIMVASFKTESNALGYLTGSVLAPVQKYTAKGINATGKFFKTIKNSHKYEKENKKLKQKIASLEDELRMLEGHKTENEKLQKLLDLKDSRKDAKYSAANVIGRNVDDMYYTLTIDKGTKDGVYKDSVVIVPEGLVGTVYEAGLNFAKVKTVLDPECAVSGICIRSGDMGIVEGNASVNSGICKMNYIDRESKIVVGDYIETSGTGGVFPKGIYVGKITDIRDDERGLTMVATIEPGANLTNICEVLVSVK